MKLLSFVSFILVLTAGWMQFYAEVRETYNGLIEVKAQVVRLKKQISYQKISHAVEREQFLEFRQTVASMMPSLLKEKGQGEQGYPYRSLASLLTKPEAQAIRATIAKTLFEQGKEYFRKEDYPRAAKVLRQLIEKYGYTSYVPESYFLLAESHFQENELEECISVIQEMIELFPSHELTGFSLVRLGRIYEIQNRNDEAIDIYKTVLRSYPQRDVASQAKKSLRGLEL